MIQYASRRILVIENKFFLSGSSVEQYSYVKYAQEFNEAVIKVEMDSVSVERSIDMLSKELDDLIEPWNRERKSRGYILLSGENSITTNESLDSAEIEMLKNMSEEGFFDRIIAYDYAVISHQLIKSDSGDIHAYAILYVQEFLSNESRKNFMLFIIVVTSIMAISFFSLLAFYRAIARSLNFVSHEISKSEKHNLKEKSDYVPDDEIGDLLIAFNEMKDRLDSAIEKENELDENRRFLISSLSHDLKTPVMTVRGYLEGLMEGIADTPDKRERYLKVSHDKIKYIEQLINDLFLYSRLNLGEEIFTMRTIEVRSFFEDLVEATTSQYEDRAIDFTHLGLNHKVFIEGDTLKLSRVFKNVIENAVKYNDKSNVLIDMSCHLNKTHVVFRISDNGPGVPANNAEDIFGRFIRLDESRNRKQGSGLGLSICKEIIEKHEGFIEAYASELGGLTIEIKLPVRGE